MTGIFTSCPAGTAEVRVPCNVVLELTFTVHDLEKTAPPDQEIDCLVTAKAGRPLTVPAFWKGGNSWAVRFASPEPGDFRYTINGISGHFEVTEVPVSANLFMRHGPVRMAGSGAYLEHSDGTPFFVLADSWWHGMTARLPFAEFCAMAEIRREQGFSSIQFSLTNPCDVAPYDDRAANEAGHPWLPDYQTLNPAYFDFIDRRVIRLIELGLLPGMTGSWGYYIGFMGENKMKQLWRYLYARYGAFPCILVLCGESKLPWYGSRDWGSDGARQTEQWTEVLRYLRSLNVFGRPVSVHPGPDIWNNNAPYPPLTDMGLIDFFYGMGGHGAVNERSDLSACIDQMNRYRAEFPGKTAMVGECLFEGMMGGGNGPKIQRALFWLSVLNGAPGHCYGADAIWQMNSRSNLFGASAFGQTWGNFPREEAVFWAGAQMAALGRKILEWFEWWRFERHPEWIEPGKGCAHTAAAAGIPGKLRLIYIYCRSIPVVLKGLDPAKRYKTTYIDPLTGNQHPCTAACSPDANGDWLFPPGPIAQDWLFLIEE